MKLPQINGLIDQVLKPDSSLPQQSDINFIFSIDIYTLDLPLRNKLMQARIVIDRKVALNIARESQPDLSDSQVIESQKTTGNFEKSICLAYPLSLLQLEKYHHLINTYHLVQQL